MKSKIQNLQARLDDLERLTVKMSETFRSLKNDIEDYSDDDAMKIPPRLDSIYIDLKNMKMRMVSDEIRQIPDMSSIEVDLIEVSDGGLDDAIYFLRSFWEEMYEKWKEKYQL